jgi:multiple sugar transport system substrate-binding protein
MKVFPRRSGVVLKAVVAGALLLAFGGWATAADKTKITFMSPLAGADGSYMDKIIQGFNAANPDVEVTHLVVGDSTEYKQKFSTAVSTNTAPEVLMIRKFDMPLYMNRFTGFTAEDYKKYGIDINDVFPNLMTGLQYQNKYVGFPLDVWIFYQAYNKANFKKAGLDPNKPPMTLDEFNKDMEAIAKVTPKGVTPYYETVTWTWIWSQYLWQFGGDLLTADFKHPAFKDAGIKVLNMLLDMQKRGIIPSAAVDAGAAFESGNSSVLITGIWTINPWSNLFKGDFGYAAVPQFGNTKAVFGGSHVIAVTDAMVKDPKKKDAAMRWVKYLWDHMLDWYGAGQTPSRKSIANSTELKTKLPAIYTVAQQASYVKSFQMFPNISEVQSELGVYLEGALFTKEMTPEVAMTKAEAAVQALLDDYWATHK